MGSRGKEGVKIPIEHIAIALLIAFQSAEGTKTALISDNSSTNLSDLLTHYGELVCECIGVGEWISISILISTQISDNLLIEKVVFYGQLLYEMMMPWTDFDRDYECDSQSPSIDLQDSATQGCCHTSYCPFTECFARLSLRFV